MYLFVNHKNESNEMFDDPTYILYLRSLEFSFC